MKNRRFDAINIHPLYAQDFNFDTPRENIETFCSILQEKVEKMKGMSQFIPNPKDKTNFCRFEWPRTYLKKTNEIHLGITFTVKKNGPISGYLYITSQEEIKNPQSQKKQEIPKSTVLRMFRKIKKTLDSSLNESETIKESDFFFVHWIENPRDLYLSKVKITSNQNNYCILPSIGFYDKKKKINRFAFAFIIKTSAKTKLIARKDCIRKIIYVCGLFSLLSKRKFEMAYNLPFHYPETVGSLEDLEDNKLISEWTKKIKIITPKKSENSLFCESFPTIYRVFQSLDSKTKDQFSQALLAYTTGLNVQDKYMTLAITSYVAALNSLAKNETANCPGNISCDVCGPIPLRHHLIGDAKAIIKMSYNILKIESDDEKKMIKKIIQSIYSNHRSSFVHSAVDHFCKTKQCTINAAAPTNSKESSDLWTYSSTFATFQELAHRILVGWIVERSTIPCELSFPQPIFNSFSFEISLPVNKIQAIIRLRNDLPEQGKDPMNYIFLWSDKTSTVSIRI